MKRTIAFLLTVVLTLFCSVTVFAAEPDDETKQTSHVDVYAKYVNNTEWNLVPVDASGNGSTTLSDGTQITVSGASEPGWQLVIDPITEKDALDWIGGVLDGKAKDLSPLHIYFIDASGNTKAADGVTVTVKLPENPNAPVAFSLTRGGKDSGLSVTIKDGTITFTTDGSPFYVLGEKVSGSTSSTGETPSTGDTPSDPGNSPQTGDTSRIGLWFAILMVSGMVLFGAVSYRKRKINH